MNKIIILIIGIFVLVGLVYASGVVFFGVNESGLVGEWHFDGNADDSSGNENDGTLLSSSVSLDNAITYTTDSKGGSHALNFPGTIVSLNQLNGDGDLPFGQSTNYQKIAQSFVAPSTGLVRSVGARRGTDGGDPNGSVYFDIANDDGGEPGTIRTTESYTDALFNVFKTDAERFHHMYTVLTPNVTYWLVYRMSTTDDSNYRNIKYDSGGSYGTLKEFNGTHWNTIPGTLRFNLRYNDDLVFDNNIDLSPNDFTIAWWMKRQNINEYEFLFSVGRDSGSGRISVGTDGKITFESRTNNVFQKTMTTNVDDVNWHHYALVSSSDNFQLYVDGVNTYSFGSANTDTADQRYRYIGAQGSQMPYTYGVGLNALLDEVKMYNRALSTTEVSQLYEDTKLKVSSLQKGLVGHWMLDSEGYNSATQRITDKTPYENHGTNDGATLTTDQMGQSERAFEFDGLDDFVAIADSSVFNTPTLTIAAWVNFLDNSNSFIFEKGNVNTQYSLFSHGTDIVFRTKPIGEAYDTLSTTKVAAGITNNQWHFIVGTYDGAVKKLYVDGVLKLSRDWVKTIETNNNGCSIGRFGGTTAGYFFNGSISSVKIYNHALNAEEIDTLYQTYRRKASAGSLHKGLVLDMPLKLKYTKDETAGSEVMTDRTPYSNDGQNYGANVGTDYTTFDGVNDYVEVPNHISLNPTIEYSVALWMLAGTPKQWSGLVGKYPYANGYLIYRGGTYGTPIGLPYVDGIRKDVSSGFSPTQGEWYHIVFTVKQEDATRIYVNGQLKGTTYIPTGVVNTNTNPLRIAGQGDGGPPIWDDGSISNVRIYNHALSESEIKLLYDKGR